jgi:hypothetical protein
MLTLLNPFFYQQQCLVHGLILPKISHSIYRANLKQKKLVKLDMNQTVRLMHLKALCTYPSVMLAITLYLLVIQTQDEECILPSLINSTD